MNLYAFIVVLYKARDIKFSQTRFCFENKLIESIKGQLLDFPEKCLIIPVQLPPASEFSLPPPFPLPELLSFHQFLELFLGILLLLSLKLLFAFVLQVFILFGLTFYTNCLKEVVDGYEEKYAEGDIQGWGEEPDEREQEAADVEKEFKLDCKDCKQSE